MASTAKSPKAAAETSASEVASPKAAQAPPVDDPYEAVRDRNITARALRERYGIAPAPRRPPEVVVARPRKNASVPQPPQRAILVAPPTKIQG